MEDNFEAEIDNYIKNHTEYQIYNQPDDGEKLVPDNWQEIADMRLRMLEKEYLSVVPQSEQNIAQEIITKQDNCEQEDEANEQQSNNENNDNNEELKNNENENANNEHENLPENSDDEFGDFQDGNYCMLGSDEDKSEHSHSDNEAEAEKPLPETSNKSLPNSQNEPVNTLNRDLGKSENFELSEEKIEKIKKAMSKISLTPPPWALSIPEDQWLNKLLYGKKAN